MKSKKYNFIHLSVNNKKSNQNKLHRKCLKSTEDRGSSRRPNILSSPLPLDWRPDISANPSMIWGCVYEGREGGRAHTHTPAQTHTHPPKDRLINAHTRPHTRIWLRKHQQHPSKLRRPPRLAPACVDCWVDTFSGFLLRQRGCGAQTPPSHTHTPLQTDVGGQIKPFSSQKKIHSKRADERHTAGGVCAPFCDRKKKLAKKTQTKKKEKRMINQGEEIKPYCHQPYCSRFRNIFFFLVI